MCQPALNKLASTPLPRGSAPSGVPMMIVIRLLFALWLALSTQPGSAAQPVASGADLMQRGGVIYTARDAVFPSSRKDIAAWRQAQTPAPQVSMFGGAYWLVAEVRNDSSEEQWVLSPGSVMVDRVEMRVYGGDGTVQQLTGGYRADYQYMLHYGKRVRLAPGASAVIVIHTDSPFYRAPLDVRLYTEDAYRHLVSVENTFILAALGALTALALFNLFVHLMKPDRATLFYALYLLLYMVAWAHEFLLPAHLLGWHDLRWSYVAFFLLAIPNTVFYVEFLQLRRHFPRLARVSRINYVLPLLLMPSSVLALSYAPFLATLVITVWLTLALASGIACLRAGHRQARYFVLAFVALVLPACLILPSNFGLVPPPVHNTELLTLVGGTLDALLLAFALAHKLRQLVGEKDEALRRLNLSVRQAHTDYLTGISNRHAFDEELKLRHETQRDELAVLLIDLDGLKAVNDRYGHTRGDALLRAFAQGLSQLVREGVTVYRLGGDEFTVLARQCEVDGLLAGLQGVELALRALGFAQAGASVGWAAATEAPTREAMVALADQRMYEHKTSRRRARADDMQPARVSLT
jgi:diguanylate cyclase (GGDEF)-like protein